MIGVGVALPALGCWKELEVEFSGSKTEAAEAGQLSPRFTFR
jgi:hypothetical protein